MAFELIKGIFGGGDYYGNKPVIPEAPKTADILKDTTAANLAVTPEAARLAALTNKYNQENILANLRGVLGSEAVDVIPGEIGQKLSSEIKGVLSPDVASQVRNRTAAEAIGRGYGLGSGMGDYSLARNYGLTSYDISNRAVNSYEQWLQTSSKLLAPTFDLSNMFASPAMGLRVAEEKYQRDYLTALTEAAPDPSKRGRFDTEMGILGMALSAYSGGPGYTNTYKPPWNSGLSPGPGQSGYTTPLGSSGGGGGFNFFGLAGGGNAPSAQQTSFGSNVPEGWDY